MISDKAALFKAFFFTVYKNTFFNNVKRLHANKVKMSHRQNLLGLGFQATFSSERNINKHTDNMPWIRN